MITVHSEKKISSPFAWAITRSIATRLTRLWSWAGDHRRAWPAVWTAVAAVVAWFWGPHSWLAIAGWSVALFGAWILGSDRVRTSLAWMAWGGIAWTLGTLAIAASLATGWWILAVWFPVATPAWSASWSERRNSRWSALSASVLVLAAVAPSWEHPQGWGPVGARGRECSVPAAGHGQVDEFRSTALKHFEVPLSAACSGSPDGHDLAPGSVSAVANSSPSNPEQEISSRADGRLASRGRRWN